MFFWGVLTGVVLSFAAAAWAYSNDTVWFKINKVFAWVDARFTK